MTVETTCAGVGTEAGRPVVRPRGVITSDRAAALAHLLETARANAGNAGGKVVVDLTHVQLLGGEALGLLVGCDDIILCNAGARVRRQLAILRLQRLLDRECA